MGWGPFGAFFIQMSELIYNLFVKSQKRPQVLQERHVGKTEISLSRALLVPEGVPREQ